MRSVRIGPTRLVFTTRSGESILKQSKRNTAHADDLVITTELRRCTTRVYEAVLAMATFSQPVLSCYESEEFDVSSTTRPRCAWPSSALPAS